MGTRLPDPDVSYVQPAPGYGSSTPNLWAPEDDGLLAASWDPAANSTVNRPGAGIVQLVRIPIRSAKTVSNLLIVLTTSGVSPEGAVYSGLYSIGATSLALLGSPTDVTTLIESAVPATLVLPLSSAQALSAGFIFGAILDTNDWSSEAPRYASMQSNRGAANVQQGSGWQRACEYTTGSLTTLPSTILKSDLSPVGYYSEPIWMGLS